MIPVIISRISIRKSVPKCKVQNLHLTQYLQNLKVTNMTIKHLGSYYANRSVYAQLGKGFQQEKIPAGTRTRISCIQRICRVARIPFSERSTANHKRHAGKKRCP